MKVSIHIASVLALFLSLAPVSVQAAIYAKFEDGPVATEGESLANGREGWIELESFSMGVENTVNIGSASGGGAGKAAFRPITLVKKVDKASPALMHTCAIGGHYETVTIEMTRPSGGPSGEVVFFKMTIKLGMVESVGVAFSEDDHTGQEEVVLQHGAHEVVVYQFNVQGAPLPNPASYKWSIVLNQPTLEVN